MVNDVLATTPLYAPAYHQKEAVVFYRETLWIHVQTYISVLSKHLFNI